MKVKGELSLLSRANLPKGWKVVPLRYAVDFRSDQLSSSTAPNYQFRYLDIGSVSHEEGISNYTEMTYSKSPSRARKLVSAGDTIISTVRTYLRSIATIYDDRDVIVSTGFSVLRPRLFEPDYLGYLAKSDIVCSEIERRSWGVAYPAVSENHIGLIHVPLPPLDEQAKISVRLNSVTVNIGRAIDLLQQELDTLERLKKSIIREAVTKGLDPTVPMKPSGVEWIGDIPMNWEAKKLKVIANFGSGTTPDSGDYSYYDGGDIPWIQSGDLYDAPRIFSTDKNVTAKAVRELSALSVYKAPFVVVAMYGASVGNTSLSVIDACMNQACCYIQATGAASNEYLFYAITSAKPDLMSKAQGGTQPNISQIVLKNHWVPCPPLVEQKRIVEALEQRVNDLDHAIVIKRRQVNLLEQQRQALIFEYVTGKRRVNEVA